MSFLRPATTRLSMGAARSVATATQRLPATTVRAISTTQRRQGSDAGKHHDHHESDIEPPSGWLWGVRPGEKYKREGWEPFMYYGYILPLVLFGIGWAFRPDETLDTWALEEARRRLEAEGILADPDPDHKLPIDGYTSTREGKHPPV